MIKVKDSNGKEYLIEDSKLINQGGEGKIFSIGCNKVAKLYFDKSSSISDVKLNELSVLDSNYFIKPELLLYGDLNGYIMRELDTSTYFPLYFLYSENFAIKNDFPADYKNEISKKMINAVKNAHDNGIVIGDLNPFNILVDKYLDVKFIDVDSYQTKTYKHGDKLLEDIRDYKYGGVVNENSDFFALSVCLFNLFTGIHPYKGIHSTYRDRLKDREVNNISLLNEKEISNIKIPKIYKPILNEVIKNEFYDIFQNNERRIIDFESNKVEVLKLTTVALSDVLSINKIFDGNILSLFSSQNYMCIVTDKENIIMKTPTKGVYVNMFKTTNDVNIILTDKYIYGIKNGVLKYYNEKENKFVDINSLKLMNIVLLKQYENILMAVTSDNKIYTVFLDEMFMNSVKYVVFDAFSKTFIKRNGLYQNIGSRSAFFFNNGKNISTVLFKEKIDDIIQNGNCGVIQYKRNNKNIFELFAIDQFNKLQLKQIDETCKFTSNEKYIVLYNENKLSFIDKSSLSEIVSFSIDGIEAYDLIMNKSGIIAYNSNEVLLVNN